MIAAYILIVVSIGISKTPHTRETYPIVTMQKFEGVRACKHAAAEIQRLARERINVVCVPEKA